MPYSVSRWSFRLPCIVVTITSLMLQLSCTKHDFDYARPWQPDREAQFFRISDHADPVVQEIVQSLKKYHKKSDFVNRLPVNAGLPIWEKLQIRRLANKISRDDDSTESIIIPLTENNENLSSVIVAAVLPGDDYSIDYHGTVEMNGICNGSDVYKAEQELGLFMLMEHHTWGRTEFYHIPQVILPQFPGRPQPDGTKVLEIAGLPGTNIAFPGCVLVPSGVHHPNEEGNCDWRTGCEYCSAYHCVTETPPQAPQPPVPTGPPTGGGGGTSGGGSGGGCGSCPPTTPPIPCDEAFYLVDPCDTNPCSPGDLIIEEQCVNPSNYPGMELSYPYLWWTDNDWLHRNFNFGSGADNVSAPDLTLDEIALINWFPVSAIRIRRNASQAETETRARFNRNGLNDKSDAFRHAFWLALNTKSVGKWKAKLFSDAHETEVPLAFQLEKTMDLHNNGVGISLCPQSSLSDAYLAQTAYNAVLNGQCKYLSPINMTDPCFWSCAGNLKGTHGITSQTQVINTNQ